MPQFSERKKLVLTFLVINCGMYQFNEKKALKYIKQNFGRSISRRTYYNYKKSMYENYEKSSLDNYPKHNLGMSTYNDLSRSSKGIISMALFTEKITIIKKGLKMGIKLTKYDKPMTVLSEYQNDFDDQTKTLLDKSRKLLERLHSRKD
ncbi:MAG: hypothetical protein L0H53_09585 [Candidatus Nitrosocosmicus sp.]|nr:hypothetical protein [Candidatus Nitrosocosmicus sp.]MDN5868004.1 hypothetical protein [Candidatus Nitrosocosmicus sp.]